MTVKIPPKEYIEEHAYLVHRGVRAMAIVGYCEASDANVQAVYFELHERAKGGPRSPLVFVVTVGGVLHYGYAARQWAADLYKYAMLEAPEVQRERIIGLLLGYGADAIDDFDAREAMTPTSLRP